ncbi:Transcriptional regulator [Penicillium chrysogenum]|uniref:Transcriptional regulator n=1 Tax=Penicillium chrysogenum TaxID=5076 RepID=A0A167UXK1_PENCH|nr:Transcriptional regulator [Penicillium chrysogenum]
MAPTKQPRISDNGKEPRRFTCMSCNKSFKRSEHCARHELMHTQERPFPCRKCGKRYGRKDLLRRHERTIHAEQYVNNAGHDMPENSPSSNASENPDPCDPPNMEDSDSEGPALHNISSSLPQPLGKGPLPQETQDNDVPSMPGEVESSLQVAPLMYHTNGLSLPSGSSLYQYGLQFPSLSTVGGHDTPTGSDPLFMHLLLGGTPGATRYTGIDDINGVVSAPNGEREIPPTSTSSQDVNHTNPAAEHPIGAACGTTLGDGFLDGLGSLDFQADLGTSPSHMWSRDPSNLTQSLPTILQEKSDQSPRYIINETDFERIHRDASVQLGNPDPDSTSKPDGTSRPRLWVLQTKILLTMFAVFSHRRSLASEMFSKIGFMMLEYQWRRIDLQNLATNRKTMTWSDWINFEQTKRALCVMFILSDSLMITFNMTPGFVIDRDLMIEAPASNELWAAKTSDEWEELQRSHPNSPQHTIQSILECMIHAPPTPPNSEP